MSSLRERVENLERDLLADPPRISAYHDLPFAILQYAPTDEFDTRQEMLLFATRLENSGRQVHFISLARIMWSAIERTEGLRAVTEEERDLQFERAQETVSTLLSDAAFLPLPDELIRRAGKIMTR